LKELTLYFIVLFAIIYFISLGKKKIYNPVVIFLAFNLINYLGSLPLLDYSYEADECYFILMSLYVFFIIIGGLIGASLFPVSSSYHKKWELKPTIVEGGIVYSEFINILILISVIISILYYMAVGYNIFLLGMVNLVTGGGAIEDAATMRLAAYNSHVGGKYLFPGYVNQFKNTLLPLTIAFTWVSYKKQNKKIPLLLKIVSLMTIIFIFGTGQRGAFVIAALMIGFFLLYVSDSKERRKLVLLGGFPVLLLFVLSSFFIGRNSAASSAGFVENVTGLLESLSNRISSANQLGAVMGFRNIIYERPIQWGSEWKQSFIGLLPGVDGSRLSSEIFNSMFGGGARIRGNAPPSSIGSIYHNFGIIGVIIIPTLISFILRYLYYRLLIKRKSLFRIMIYTSSFILIGAWIAGNPTYLFNVGLFALIFLHILLKICKKIFGKKSILVFPKGMLPVISKKANLS